MEDDKYEVMEYINDNGIEAYIEKEKPLTEQDLIKFINYAHTLDPVFMVGTFKHIREQFKILKAAQKGKDSVNIDTRSVEDVKRGAYAFAKLGLSEVVTIKHADQAMNLYRDSLRSFGSESKEEHERIHLSNPVSIETLD